MDGGTVDPARAPGASFSIRATGPFSKQIRRLLGAFQVTRRLGYIVMPDQCIWFCGSRQDGEVDTIRPLAVLNAPLYSVTSSSICCAISSSIIDWATA